jgi:hypothetical protein
MCCDPLLCDSMVGCDFFPPDGLARSVEGPNHTPRLEIAASVGRHQGHDAVPDATQIADPVGSARICIQVDDALIPESGVEHASIGEADDKQFVGGPVRVAPSGHETGLRRCAASKKSSDFMPHGICGSFMQWTVAGRPDDFMRNKVYHGESAVAKPKVGLAICVNLPQQGQFAVGATWIQAPPRHDGASCHGHNIFRLHPRSSPRTIHHGGWSNGSSFRGIARPAPQLSQTRGPCSRR